MADKDELVVEEIPMYETEPDPSLRPEAKLTKGVDEGESVSIEPLSAPVHGSTAQPYAGIQTMHQKELPKSLSAEAIAKIPPGQVTGSTVNDWTKSPSASWSLSMLPDLTPAYRQANAV